MFKNIWKENFLIVLYEWGVSLKNGQVERIHGTITPVFTNVTVNDGTNLFKYVDKLERILNSTITRSTKNLFNYWPV